MSTTVVIHNYYCIIIDSCDGHLWSVQNCLSADKLRLGKEMLKLGLCEEVLLPRKSNDALV